MMKLYSSAISPSSHRCRLLLHEKEMDFQIIDVDPHSGAEGLAFPDLHYSLPALVERDLTLYESNIIHEYIDDRFPHPRLMPLDPALRARTRLALYGFEQELFCHIDAEEASVKITEKVRAAIQHNLTVIAAALAKQQYLLGDEYSMLDVAIAPLLWRLERYEIKLPKEAKPLLEYAERLFGRPAFIHATTASEKAMRA